ncbi:hypothetical protein GGH92_001365 [Coemansia sp. RSA 2673]|nr:hypothetical protein GGH92_001365 [Coemansia sp. RSA 2673]
MDPDAAVERQPMCGKCSKTFCTMSLLKRHYYAHCKVKYTVHGITLALLDDKDDPLRAFCLCTSDRSFAKEYLLNEHLKTCSDVATNIQSLRDLANQPPPATGILSTEQAQEAADAMAIPVAEASAQSVASGQFPSGVAAAVLEAAHSAVTSLLPPNATADSTSIESVSTVAGHEAADEAQPDEAQPDEAQPDDDNAGNVPFSGMSAAAFAMTQLRLKLDKSTGVVVCLHCKRGILLESYVGHYTLNHLVNGSSADRIKHNAVLCSRIDNYLPDVEQYLSTFPAILTTKSAAKAWLDTRKQQPGPRIDGIDVIDGYKCISCAYVCGASKSLFTHISDQRKKESMSTDSVHISHDLPFADSHERVPVQQVFTDIGIKQHVEVHPLPSLAVTPADSGLTSEDKAYCQMIFDQLQTDKTAHPSSDTNTLLFVKVLQWNKLSMEPDLVDFALEIHSCKDHPWFHSLAGIAFDEIQCVSAFIKQAGNWLLRDIGCTMKPGAEASIKHDWLAINHEGGQRAYSHTMARLLFAVTLAFDKDSWARLLRLTPGQVEQAQMLAEYLRCPHTDISDMEFRQRFWQLAIELFAYAVRMDIGSLAERRLCLHIFHNNTHPISYVDTEHTGCGYVHSREHTTSRYVVGRSISTALTNSDTAGGAAMWDRRCITPNCDAESDLLSDRVNLRPVCAGTGQMNVGRNGVIEALRIFSSVASITSISMMVNTLRDVGFVAAHPCQPLNYPMFLQLHVLLRDNLPTPFGSLQAANGKLLSAAADVSGNASIRWVNGSQYKSLVFRNQQQVNLSDFSNAFIAAVWDIKRQLDVLLEPLKLPDGSFPLLPDIADLHDDMNDQQSFLLHQANNLAKFRTALFKANIASKRFRRLDNSATQSTRTDTDSANMASICLVAGKKWLAAASKLNGLLMFAIHISSGQPARGPELNSLMVNDWASQPRSLYIYDKHIAAVTRYWKGEAKHCHSNFVMRLLPATLGCQLLRYLIFVKPCEALVACTLLPSTPGIPRQSVADADNYLFTSCGQRITDQEVRDKIVSVWASKVHYKLLFNDIRHLMHAFQVQAGAISKEDWQMDMLTGDSEFDGDMQADKSIDNVHEWISGTHEHIRDQIRISGMVTQAAHSAPVARMTYGRTMQDLYLISAQKALEHQKTSYIWHNMLVSNITGHPDLPDLAFDTATVAEQAKRVLYGCARSAATPNQPNVQVNVSQTFNTVSNVNLPHGYRPSNNPANIPSDFRDISACSSPSDAQLIRQIYRARRTLMPTIPGDRFKSASQLRAICQLIKCEKNVMVVLPTGGGKSLVYQLAAYMEKTLNLQCFTLVVSPLAALTLDIQTECQKHGIPCITWRLGTQTNVSELKGVVVTAVESFGMDDFCDFLDRSLHGKHLRRVVYDEAHLYRDWHTFRRAMTLVQHSNVGFAQKVLLSATIPPHLEQEVYECFYNATVTPRPDIDIIREPTSRPNIAYSIHIESTRDIALHTLPVKSAMFHGQLLDKDMASIWHQSGINLASIWHQSAINLPSLNAVFHFGGSYSLLHFAQESGRPGRLGQPATSVVVSYNGFVDEHKWRIQASQEGGDSSVKIREFTEFCNAVLSQKHCIRAQLSHYLHHRPEECISNSINLLCSFCQQLDSSTTTSPPTNMPISTNSTTFVHLQLPQTTRPQQPPFSRLSTATTAHDLANDNIENDWCFDLASLEESAGISSTVASQINDLQPTRRQMTLVEQQQTAKILTHPAHPPLTQLHNIPAMVLRHSHQDLTANAVDFVSGLLLTPKPMTATSIPCPLCHWFNNSTSRVCNHEYFQCPTLQNIGRDTVVGAKPRCVACAGLHSVRECHVKWLDMKGGSVCGLCSLPQTQNNPYHTVPADGKATRFNCNYFPIKDHVLLLVNIAWRIIDQRDKMVAALGLPKETTYKSFRSWCTDPVAWAVKNIKPSSCAHTSLKMDNNDPDIKPTTSGQKRGWDQIS